MHSLVYWVSLCVFFLFIYIIRTKIGFTMWFFCIYYLLNYQKTFYTVMYIVIDITLAVNNAHTWVLRNTPTQCDIERTS